MKASPKYRRIFDPENQWHCNWSRQDAAKVLSRLRKVSGVRRVKYGVYRFMVGLEVCTLVTVQP